MVDKIQANYAELEKVQKEFAQLEERVNTLRGRILVAYQAIQDGEWQGEGSKAFKEEMESQVLLHLSNMGKAMNKTGVVIGSVATKFSQAEEAVKASSPERTAGG